jgi:adenylate cyclase
MTATMSDDSPDRSDSSHSTPSPAAPSPPAPNRATARRPGVIVEGQTVVTTEIVERPPTERPVQDSIDNIAQWLIGDARAIGTATRALDEYAWRLHAAGLPVLRVTFHTGTLHPQFLGAAYVWWRTTAQTQEIMIMHEVADLLPYNENPVLRVRRGGETLRRRLDGPQAQLDFAVLHDIKARGGTDYLALPVRSANSPMAYMTTYVTDRPDGFSDEQIAQLQRLSERLSIIADMHSQRQIAENVLKAYLGPQTGPRVLAGQIRRGTGEAIDAVLWSSDVRSFTALSDRVPGQEVIAILDQIFDAQARAIANHGGEILKFIGDGLLAIFPVATPDEATPAATEALAAAGEAIAAVQALGAQSPDEAPLKMVIALHYGSAIYGNIGAADRLDFTVIGPGVNLVSRVEAIGKSLDLPLIVSDDFAHVHGGTLKSLGRHKLRGLEQAHELFTLPDAG